MSWTQTVNGIKFDLLEPDSKMIKIEDIATSLANQCRFTGQVRYHYSIAQHSVLCSERCNPLEDRIWGLMHDSAEAYIGDISRPVKSIPGVGEALKPVENRILGVIQKTLGLPPLPWSEQVTYVDNRMLVTEGRDLVGPQVEPWSVKEEPYSWNIEPWSIEFARNRFYVKYQQLMYEWHKECNR